MRNNPEYLELNRRLSSALRESEAVAKELFDFRCKRNIEKGEVNDDPLVLRMDRDLSAVLEGLQSHDPRIREESLSKIGKPWKYPASAAPFIREMALHEPDLEVQLFAIYRVVDFKDQFLQDSELLRELARLAQSTDDVTTRHSIYLVLCQVHSLYDIRVFGLKYVLNPLVYDEGIVAQYATKLDRPLPGQLTLVEWQRIIAQYANESDRADACRADVKPKAFDFWGWFRKKRTVGDNQPVPNPEA